MQHSPFLLPVKAKGRAGLVEPWGRPASMASPSPGSPLLLQLLAQNVPPPGWHAGQARLLLLLLQQTAALPALPGAHPHCWHRGAAALPRRMVPHPAGGQAEPRSQPARGLLTSPLAARLLPARGGGRSAQRGQPFAAHHSFIALTRGGPTLPRHRKHHARGEHSPGTAPPAQHTATASGTPQPLPGSTRTNTKPSTEPSRGTARAAEVAEHTRAPGPVVPGCPQRLLPASPMPHRWHSPQHPTGLRCRTSPPPSPSRRRSCGR